MIVQKAAMNKRVEITSGGGLSIIHTVPVTNDIC